MALTLRPDEQQENHIKELKIRLNQKSSSKALFQAAEEVPKMMDEIFSKKMQIKHLTDELERLRESVKCYHAAKENMLLMANKNDDFVYKSKS